MTTELSGSQISSLLETLPGIAKVLRSPVADAMVNLIKAATGQDSFSMADAEELLRYAVRRNLVAADESEVVLQEAKVAMSARKPAAAPAARKRAKAPAARTRAPAARKAAARKPAAKARKPATKKAPRKPKAAAKGHRKK